MVNVIKMNFFLLLRQKSAYIILVGMVVMVFTATARYGQTTNQENSLNTGNGQEIKLYETGYADYETQENIAAVLASTFNGNLVPMMLMVYCGLFIGTYHRFKLEKNIAGIAGEKYKLTLSFLVIHAIYTAAMMLLLLIANILGYFVAVPEFTSWPPGNISDFLAFIGVYYILMLSICTVMTCFVDLVANPIAAIVIALIYGSTIPYALIDFFAKIMGIENFSVQNILPLGIALQLTIDETAAHYVKAISLSLALLAVALVVNIAIRKKRDVLC